mgnify:CR=1 FL=1
MIDLSNVTFIIPLRIESDDRLRNIILSTSFLLNNFDCKVLIKESDQEANFGSFAYPQIQKIAPTENLEFHHENSVRDYFHRTKLLNEMVMMTTTDIVVNYDSDIILPISSYVEAKRLIDEKEAHVVYPYKFGEKGERKVTMNTKVVDEDDLNSLLDFPLIKKFISGFNPEVLDESYVYAENVNGMGWSEYGMCQFFNTKAYKDGYLENENFIAYAPEDVERHHRWNMLGYNIGRVDNHAYHMEHKRTQNSWFNNPFMHKNNSLWETLKSFSEEEIHEYYQNQTYYKERIK